MGPVYTMLIRSSGACSEGDLQLWVYIVWKRETNYIPHTVNKAKLTSDSTGEQFWDPREVSLAVLTKRTLRDVRNIFFHSIYMVNIAKSFVYPL